MWRRAKLKRLPPSGHLYCAIKVASRRDNTHIHLSSYAKAFGYEHKSTDLFTQPEVSLFLTRKWKGDNLLLWPRFFMKIFYRATACLGVCVEKGDTSVCLELAYFYATISFIRAYKEKTQRDVHHIDGRSRNFHCFLCSWRGNYDSWDKRKVRRHCPSLAFLTIWIYNMKKEELKISCETEK